ncbi:hypothetical protein HELRODRAFT_193284 [Helobdella robusta]|uniref:Uncharacterized protein n=1 Tax=Helobdella robusta TaxID=6412 RepID=T1FUU1_HELRO|nr:hypothetical protein HELRODRAFT_193284 [Helobdella robusta]ESN97160.1 hypothetical protein HELRODRAFT_193284 [Helobdella robusta]
MKVTGISITCVSLFIGVALSADIRCYTCSHAPAGANSPGFECINNPEKYTLGPNTGICNLPCSVTNQSINGQLWYVTRGCQMEPPGDSTTNGVDKTVTICNKELCNDRPVGNKPINTTPAGTTTTTTEPPGTIWCYSCVYSYNGPGSDDRCVRAPNQVPSPNLVRCPPSRKCSTYRQYDKGEKVVRSFRRGCDPVTWQGCTDDIYFKTCQQFCQGDYCNNGDLS